MKGIGKAQILTFISENFDVDVVKKAKAIDKALTTLVAPTNPVTTEAKVLFENDLYRYISAHSRFSSPAHLAVRLKFLRKN